jgi:PAS domain S-box-containing protein
MLRRCAALTVPASVAIILAIGRFQSPRIFEPPWLLPLLNTVLLSAVACIVAYVAARAYRLTGSLSLLAFGSGVLMYGTGSLLAGWLTGAPGGLIPALTTHNTAAALGGALLLVSALAATQVAATHPARLRPRIVSIAYLAVVTGATIVAALSLMGLTPVFFIPGAGFTPVRNVTLGAAVACFALAAILVARRHQQQRQADFLYWQALALAMFAIGLGALFLQPEVGSLVGWAGRGVQYVGSLYLLVAVGRAARDATRQQLPLERTIAALFRNAEEQYRTLIETATYAIITVDETGRVLLWNAAAERTFGYPRAEAIGRPLSDLTGLPPAIWALDSSALAKESSVQGITATPVEAEVRRKDGEPFPAEVSVSRHETDSGWIGTLILRDITARKQAEEERQLTSDLLRLANTKSESRELIEAVVTHLRRWLDCDAVGVRLRAGDDFPYFEAQGFSADFVEMENRLCAVDASGAPVRDATGKPVLECMCGNILRGRFDPSKSFFTAAGSFWTNSTSALLATTTDEDRLAPMHIRCTAQGYESVTLIPLCAGAETIGLLQVNDRRKGRFTPERIALLERVGNSIASALAERRTRESLRESERKFIAFMDFLPGHAYIKDGEGRHLFVNKGLERYFGTASAACVGKTFAELVPADPGAGQAIAGHDARVLASRMPFLSEVTVDSEGVHRTFLASKFPIPREDGGALLGGIAIDITERKRAEAALEASEARYRSLYATMNDAVVLHELVRDASGHAVDYRILDCNPAFTRLTEITREQAVGARASALYGTGTAPYLEIYERVTTTGEPVTWETHFAPMDKHFRIGVFTPAPGQFATVTSDITAFRQMEAALRMSEELYRSVHEHSPLAVVLWTLDGRITDWNRRAEALFGWTKAEVVGQRWLDLLVPPAERASLGDLPRILEQQGSLLQTNTNMTKDGGTLACEWHNRLLTDAAGAPRAVISLGIDVSERRSLEEQLQQSQKLEAVGRLAGGVAHDFNNLLTVILGVTELLQLQAGHDAQVRARAEEILTAARRAAELTGQLLAFSRRQILQPQLVNVNAVLTDAERMLRRLIGEDIILRLFPAPDLGAVRADPAKLLQVIVNLAVNARDAMPQGGQLTLETQNILVDREYVRTHPIVQPGPYVLISVSDTGVGMDETTRAHLFEPFFTTKAKGRGTGLGLSVVYGIIRQSNGFIWVYSEPGHGATFKIYLPRVLETIEPAGPVPAPPTRVTGTETILVVEDEAAVRTLAAEILRSKGYTLLEAGGPHEALAAAQAHQGHLHLLLTDVVMPELSGQQLAGQLWALRPDLRVLYMSGYTDNAIVHHGVLDPGTSFLPKPFTPGALLQKVREVLDGR